MIQQFIPTNDLAVPKNLVLQAIAYLKQHDDPMAKMLVEQFQVALQQEERDRGNKTP